MEGPANTVNYFVAGYSVIFGVLAFLPHQLIRPLAQLETG